MRRPSLRRQRAEATASEGRAPSGALAAVVANARQTLSLVAEGGSHRDDGLNQEVPAATTPERGRTEPAISISSSGTVNRTVDDGPSVSKRSRIADGPPPRNSEEEVPTPAVPIARDPDLPLSVGSQRRSEEVERSANRRSGEVERSTGRRSDEVERSAGRRSSSRDVARAAGGRDYLSNSENGSSSSRPFHWKFTHNRDFLVIEDEPGMANLLRHFKGQGC